MTPKFGTFCFVKGFGQSLNWGILQKKKTSLKKNMWPFGYLWND